MEESTQFSKILNDCRSDIQRQILESFRDMVLPVGQVKDTTKTRHIKYGQKKKHDDSQPIYFAEIAYLLQDKSVRGNPEYPWYNPQAIIKLPMLVQDSRKISSKSKRYGFAITENGSFEEEIYIYNVNKKTINQPDKPKVRIGTLSRFFNYQSFDNLQPLEILQNLISFSKQHYF